LSPGLILFLLLVAMPIVEVATFIEIGGRIGLWPTIALVIATAAIGTAIIRWQGIGLISAVQRQTAEGKMPAFEIFSGICLLVGGALLLTPGFVTDTLGFLLLSPGLRRRLFARVEKRIELHGMRAGGVRFGNGEPRRRRKPAEDDIIEADFTEIDDPDDMPPPGRGWGSRDDGGRP